MDVCCLKMASRCSRPTRAIAKDITKLSNAGSSHDCGSLSRVVMVRKTDQRVFNRKSQKDPQTETITMETIQTYKGHRPDRTVVIKKRDLSANATLSSSSDHGYSSLTTSNHTKSELSKDLSKDFSSLSLMTTDEPTINSTNSSPNTNNPRRSFLNGSMSRDSNNNNNGTTIYGTPTMSAKQNRNTINSRIRNEDRLTKSTSNLRHSTPSPICTKRSQYNEFELDCLRAHNEYRLRHGVSPLKLNKKLCRYAEEWAKIIASRGVLVHRNNSQYGENIFCSWSSISSNVCGREPVDNWYGEYINHVFHKEPTTLKSGHFTQVVWKESRELGIGMAKNRAGEVFVVAYYDPPGNYIGSFEKNVLPIIDLMDNGKSFDDAPALDNENCVPSHEEFDLAMVKMHNEYRRKHGAPELKLTKELMNDAQQWAETLAQDDRFTYRQNSQYGENLYCLWSSDRDATPNARDVCKSWYEEVKQYTWNTEPKGSFKAGQFTQMVWKSSKELGIGVARTKNGKVIIVASYYPRGNIIGNFLNNVKRNN